MACPSSDVNLNTTAERLARRGIRLQAPPRPEAPAGSNVIAANAAVPPPPGCVVLWDEVVWGDVAPALWVAPSKSIDLSRSALCGADARWASASVH